MNSAKNAGLNLSFPIWPAIWTVYLGVSSVNLRTAVFSAAMLFESKAEKCINSETIFNASPFRYAIFHYHVTAGATVIVITDGNTRCRTHWPCLQVKCRRRLKIGSLPNGKFSNKMRRDALIRAPFAPYRHMQMHCFTTTLPSYYSLLDGDSYQVH